MGRLGDGRYVETVTLHRHQMHQFGNGHNGWRRPSRAVDQQRDCKLRLAEALDNAPPLIVAWNLNVEPGTAADLIRIQRLHQQRHLCASDVGLVSPMPIPSKRIRAEAEQAPPTREPRPRTWRCHFPLVILRST